MEIENSNATKIQCYISPSTGDRIMEKVITKPGRIGAVLERTNFTKGTKEELKKF